MMNIIHINDEHRGPRMDPCDTPVVMDMLGMSHLCFSPRLVEI